MSKAYNKKLMSELRVSSETYAAHEDQWVFRADNRSVDLRTTAGYRQHVHSKRDELALVGQALKHGLTSGPVGLKNLLLAKGSCVTPGRACAPRSMPWSRRACRARRRPASVRPRSRP